VHRIISAALSGKSFDEVKRKYSLFAERAGKKSSECEMKALEAERGISDLYKAVYMSKHIGEEFDAIVSSVTSFGMFCMLDNTCEGLVPINMMKNRYRYNQEAMTLSCGSIVYRIGDKVRIKVKDVSVSLRQVDFELADEKEFFWRG
jgi:ribonuclease R